jgi:hypothetical protein
VAVRIPLRASLVEDRAGRQEAPPLEAGRTLVDLFFETRLRTEPLISQAVVIGDGRKYLTALVSTLKVKRSVVIERFGDLVEEMYAQ